MRVKRLEKEEIVADLHLVGGSEHVVGWVRSIRCSCSGDRSGTGGVAGGPADVPGSFTSLYAMIRLPGTWGVRNRPALLTAAAVVTGLSGCRLTGVDAGRGTRKPPGDSDCLPGRTTSLGCWCVSWMAKLSSPMSSVCAATVLHGTASVMVPVDHWPDTASAHETGVARKCSVLARTIPATPSHTLVRRSKSS